MKMSKVKTPKTIYQLPERKSTNKEYFEGAVGKSLGIPSPKSQSWTPVTKETIKMSPTIHVRELDGSRNLTPLFL